jgi:hypothetical protein
LPSSFCNRFASASAAWYWLKSATFSSTVRSSAFCKRSEQCDPSQYEALAPRAVTAVPLGLIQCRVEQVIATAVFLGSSFVALLEVRRLLGTAGKWSIL